MPISHNEIIEEIERHIRKFGGGQSEWCVGTAKDARAPFFRRHLAADLGDGLIYREAFTTSAAEQVLDHLVNACGLKLAPEAEPGSALPEAIEPGRIVFVYRRTRDSGREIRDTGLGARDTGLETMDSGKTGTAAPSPANDHALFPRRAA
jgi:hypothetical protein